MSFGMIGPSVIPSLPKEPYYADAHRTKGNLQERYKDWEDPDPHHRPAYFPFVLSFPGQGDIPNQYAGSALPDVWNGGRIAGLTARGGFEVAMNWKNKKLTSASILSVAGDAARSVPHNL